MRMNLAVAALLAAMNLFAFTKEEALNDPYVQRFEQETFYELAPHLEKALNNMHWNRANEMLYHESVTKKYGNKDLVTIDVQGAVAEYIHAGRQGILLASWQGLNVAKTLAPMKGKWYESVVPVLAKQLISMNVCQGYIDLGVLKGRGWGGTSADFEAAVKVFEEGRAICNSEKAQSWQKEQWARQYYKYKTLLDFPGALKYNEKK